MSSRSSKNGGDSSRLERSSTNTTDSGFWTTIELLMERDRRNNRWEASDENPTSNDPDLKTILKQRKPKKNGVKTAGGEKFKQVICDVQNMEDVQPQLSLWETPKNAMTSSREKSERFVDKEMLRRLQQNGKQEKMEAQQHRIKAREMEEKNRLKKLILNGKSNLDDCPADMRNNPVYIFWRLVNKEMEKINKARAVAYYKKYRKSRRGTRRSSHREATSAEEDSVVSRSEESPEPKDSPVSEMKDVDEEPIMTFTIPENLKIKYEDEGVKELRTLMTVRELYQMADKIIGAPREITISDDSTPR